MIAHLLHEKMTSDELKIIVAGVLAEGERLKQVHFSRAELAENLHSELKNLVEQVVEEMKLSKVERIKPTGILQFTTDFLAKRKSNTVAIFSPVEVADQVILRLRKRPVESQSQITSTPKQSAHSAETLPVKPFNLAALSEPTNETSEKYPLATKPKPPGSIPPAPESITPSPTTYASQSIFNKSPTQPNEAPKPNHEQPKRNPPSKS